MEKINHCMAALREAVPEIEVVANEPMSRHTTFAIGGPADLFISPKTTEQLAGALAAIRRCGVPFLVLGNGSNMLVADAGYRGAVICTTEMDDVRAGEDGTLVAQAGALLGRVARRAQRAGLTGAEFSGGIPGSVGGAVFMNAGAYDGQMAGIVEKTEYLDGEGNLRTLTGDEHCFGYRSSAFRAHPDWTVVRTTMRLQPGDPAAILDKMNDFAQRRRDKQPLNYPSAGSTFKRPEGYFAGRLIEDAGLKGVSVGAAQVSEKHAGFLINRGGATCDEMLRLIELVQQRVREKFGVELECEVRIVR
ncbi:UDP-N-acetylmuramate dehydrogenase [Agathobaculum sp. Marseille-P7918]|uniref:UDP-N-acetylmuramate dehydrogenase n=1 Tax=Agathobaculum sp. Marseille-P7918 TaxID=2479843 RepID=UPI000F6321A0|nr:UDP-N-acetylmuramate dehydrogenase [Agathobaculum sp. Marseille-P7918]